MSIPRYQGVDRYVGNTPLIRLRHLSELTGCEVLGKAKFMNPGGSVKDRAAYGIITDAEQRGLLKPGATIVEGTAGNTGIGLTVGRTIDRKSTRLNSSHRCISYAVFCLNKK